MNSKALHVLQISLPKLTILCFACLLPGWQFAAGEQTQQSTQNASLASRVDVERIISLPADPAYGEYLAGECLTCHQANSGESAIPVIQGLPPSAVIAALLDFKSGERKNDVMQLMATNLGEEEIAALAAFFAQQ